ncbi:MAG: hypothetical protein NTY30_01710 [Candidatus Berkelbacteria bacterium]|nr:hypothetical protein [Candidatus Berkelbacteria bacterium]
MPTDHNPTVVFTPTFNWLNAVSVRIKGTNPTGTPRVQAQIWDWHSNPHRLLAMNTVELVNRTSEYWQPITESSQDMDPGLQYALVLVPKDGTQVYWSATITTSCYARGYAMHDGIQDNGMMYGFSTYGWLDPNNPNSNGQLPGSSSGTSGTTGSAGTTGNTGAGAPTADPAGNNPTGVGSSSSTGSGTSGSGSSPSNSSNSPSDKDIAALLADYKNGSGGFGDLVSGLFFSPIVTMIILPILSFLFWAGVIILIIILIVRHNKKKKLTVAVAPAVTPVSPVKPEEKKSEPEKK